MQACDCNETLANTGTVSCPTVANVTKKVIFVPTFDNDGALNKLDLSVELSQAVLDALINESDASKRWYPTPLIENVVTERADSSFDEAPSGRKAFIKQGTKNTTYEIWKEGGALQGQLEKIRCSDVSVFIIDIDGGIRGTITDDNDGFLYPVKIDNDSFDVKMIDATDTTVAKLAVTYDYDQTESDSSLRMISSGDITADLLGANGLLDISSTIIGVITTSTVTVKLTTIFGSAGNLITDKGLIDTDFALAELSPTPGVVVISTVVENPDGTYLITFATATSGDVLELTPTKAGRDYTQVIANTILIP